MEVTFDSPAEAARALELVIAALDVHRDRVVLRNGGRGYREGKRDGGSDPKAGVKR